MDKPQTQAIPPPLEDMNRMAVWILDTLKNQGLSFLLLGLAVWHLQAQNNELSKLIRDCQEEKYNALITVVSHNTAALNNITNGKEETPPVARKKAK